MLDLDLTSQGHSRSKPMAPFERASMTSYSTFIVTMRLSVTVWKIQPFENAWPNGQQIFRQDRQVSWYEWTFAISSWHVTIRTFICTFFSTFSVIIQWHHDIWCHTSWYELLGPWPMCPPSFIEISWSSSNNNNNVKASSDNMNNGV